MKVNILLEELVYLISQLYYDKLGSNRSEIIKKEIKDFLKFCVLTNKQVDVYGYTQWNFSPLIIYKNLPIAIKNRNDLINDFLTLYFLNQKFLEEAFTVFVAENIGDNFDVLICDYKDNSKNNPFNSSISVISRKKPVPICEIHFYKGFEDLVNDRTGVNTIKDNIKNNVIYQKETIPQDYCFLTFLRNININVDLSKLFNTELLSTQIVNELGKIFGLSNKQEIVKKFIFSSFLPFLVGFKSYIIILTPLIKNLFLSNIPKRRFLNTATVLLSREILTEDENFNEFLYSLIITHIGRVKEVVTVDLLNYSSSHALRSAVASIMSRNMSHIHGSHIEPGLQHKISTFGDEIINRLKGV